MPDEPFDYLQRNQDAWDRDAASYVAPGRRAWASMDPTWGIWDIPEDQLPDVAGMDTVELGCGTGYVSAWLARRGARPIGIDPTPNQLVSARAFQAEFAITYPLVRAAAEHTPLRDGCCDLVISEYGAAIWSDPYRWIPEAARLLRPGGELVFLGNAALLMLCCDDYDGGPTLPELRRPYFGMHRFEWPDETSVEFHITHGDWIRVLRANGFIVEDLIELQAPADAADRTLATAEWAHQWPTEEVWKARKPFSRT
jgi:SAM-dependent methyltransferase